MRLLPIVLLLAACSGQPRPSGKEICGDGYDNDNDGLSDCADEDCLGVEVDLDGDGDLELCPEFCGDGKDNDADGLVDCDDPACDGSGCAEVCNDGRDNDKDGKWDCDDLECQAECDADGDGFYNADYGGDDCDDSDPSANPMGEEVCDGVDNDCNGDVDMDDEGLDQTTLTDWFEDDDGDGYGEPGSQQALCDAPPYTVDVDGDCDDSDPFVNPAALELCDGIDNDCDLLLDDEDPSVDLTSAVTWYPDADGDGFGVNQNPVDACMPPADHAPNPDDCDDTDPTITSFGMWIQDTDGDGYGDPALGTTGPAGCTPPGPGYVSENTPADCDDTDVVYNPGAVDLCADGLDYDCDGQDCTAFFDGFEQGIGQFTLGGNANPFAQQNTVYAGGWAAETGNIGDNQSSWFEITRSFPGGGTLSCWHSGSTEANFDFLRIYVDGSQVFQKAGTWTWEEYSQAISPGTHTIRWSYEKDITVSSGSDTVWVDDIRLEGAN